MGTTAQKLEYLNTTKTKIKESINLTNANITNEPFRQYAVILKNRLPEIVGDPSIIWNNYEHVTGSGTSFSINSYNSIFNYDIKGDTVQNGTPTPTSPIPINVVSGDNTINVNSNSYPINLGDIELCKIGNYQDYIYKDNGSWYLHKRINKVVLDGTNVNEYVNYLDATTYSIPRIQLSKSNLGFKSSWDTGIALLNKYSEITTSGAVSNGTFALNFQQAYINIFDSRATDIATARNILIGTEIYIIKATPTNTEITDANLILQLNSVRLVNGLNNITTVGSDLNPILNIEAIKHLD